MTPEQRAARLHYHMYDSLEGIEQQSERIVTLEELVMDVWRACPAYEDDCKRCQHYVGDDDIWCDFVLRMCELGIEVE